MTTTDDTKVTATVTPAAPAKPDFATVEAAALTSDLQADTAGMIVAFREADEALDGNGYRAFRTATAKAPLTLDALTGWVPKAGNPIEDFVRLQHATVAHEHSPKGREILSEILKLAVDSVIDVGTDGRTLALAARDGELKSGKPDFGKVPLTRIGNNKPEATDPKTALEAYERLETIRDNAAGWELEAVTDVLAAIDSKDDLAVINGLRRCAARLQRMQTRANRFRSILFLPYAVPMLDDYEASKPLKKVEGIWTDVVAAAQAAHKEYMGDNAKSPDKAALDAALKAAIDKVLASNRGFGTVTKARTTDEKFKAACERLWATLKVLDTLAGTGQKMTFAVRPVMKGFDIIDPAEAAEEQAAQEKAESERKRIAAEAKAKADAAEAQAREKQAKADAAATAKAARDTERAALQAASAASGATGKVTKVKPAVAAAPAPVAKAPARKAPAKVA